MENRAHALVAGLFMMLLGAALVAAVMWFRGDHVRRTEHLVVARTGVPGLSVKAPVKLRGVEVGTVSAIAFDPDDPKQILIRIAVDSAAPLSRGTTAQLGYQGITGLSFIDLGDTGNDPRPLASAPDDERRIALQPSLFDQLATTGPALLAGFSETARRLNTLLERPNQERLSRVLDTADRSLGQMGDRAQELAPAVAKLPVLLQHLYVVSVHADATLQRADDAASEATKLVSELRGKLNGLDAISQAAARVDTAVAAIELGLVGTGSASERPLVEELGRTARGVDRAVGQWAEQPQSLLFGKALGRAGPGEAGFDASRGTAR